MMKLLSFTFVLTCIFPLSPLHLAWAEELANRRGVESHWKRSGRVTRVIDYPFSPAMGTYGRFWRREWGNRGYLFTLPSEEVILENDWPPGKKPTPVTEDSSPLEQPATEPPREESSRERLNAEIVRLRAELDQEQARAEDEAIKRKRMEMQLEEMEKIVPPAGRAPAELTPSGTDLYLVRPKDNLWKIAGRPEVYNDPFKWLLLYHANRGQIFHPDWIYPDMVLIVPRYPALEHSVRLQQETEASWSVED